MVGVAFGVQFVVGADHDVGLNFCDDFCDFDAERDFVVHAAVLKRQKSDVLNAQNFRGCQLFVAADFNKRFGRHVFVFRAEPSVGSYIRSSVHETKDFAEAKAKMPEVKYPLLDAFKRYPKMMVACMGARLIDGVAFNTFAVFSLSYLTQTRGLERSSALAVVMIASVVMSFFIPFWGYVADRIGKARVFGFCALLLGILGFPAFWVFHNYSDNYLYVCLALALPFGVVYAAVFGTMSSLFSDSFDPSVRYSAISFVYQFSGIFAAGLTPMVATMLVAWNGGEPWYLCAYLGSAGLISAACTLWIRHLNRKGFPPALPVEGETPVSEPLMEGESA